jgi:hypothetical protein
MQAADILELCQEGCWRTTQVCVGSLTAMTEVRSGVRLISAEVSRGDLAASKALLPPRCTDAAAATFAAAGVCLLEFTSWPPDPFTCARP